MKKFLIWLAMLIILAVVVFFFTTIISASVHSIGFVDQLKEWFTKTGEVVEETPEIVEKAVEVLKAIK